MSAVVEQYSYGFRYRVTKGVQLYASSVVYVGFDEALYALQSRFPGIIVDRVVVL